MQIHNVYYDVNISGLKLINQDYNEYYFKDNSIKRLYRSYNIFKTLLHQNKSIRDKTKRLSQMEIQQLANISKATFYRYKKLLNTKDWKGIEKDRLNNRHYRPKNLRRSLILDYSNSNNNNNNNNNKTLLTIVKDIRNKYPTYSKYKIYAILNRDYNISSNYYTLYTINSFL